MLSYMGTLRHQRERNIILNYISMNDVNTVIKGGLGIASSFMVAEVPQIAQVNISTIAEALVQLVIAVATVISLFGKKKV